MTLRAYYHATTRCPECGYPYAYYHEQGIGKGGYHFHGAWFSSDCYRRLIKKIKG